MIEDYFNINIKRLLYFAGAIIMAASVTTLLYWFLYGFDTWKNSMNTASDLMLAAAPGG
ncbi:conserved hypothetical protein [Desulfamplus magnetovallimortis]|uniref:Uncharacterized protein n=1 Tax=Desulfamplus magnetovallimortis TaxID=1246637 RepID=L0R553_9BACT|nr:hypothetical protein [Desulfamplus magnetovallimortis]CCO06682.1 conserved hypothetical protein [Desulfamplus magnetovallimortis BW-1]SLM32733.1 conserved hypothetical protein [Desulfamplus magnetovallimortis]